MRGGSPVAIRELGRVSESLPRARGFTFAGGGAGAGGCVCSPCAGVHPRYPIWPPTPGRIFPVRGGSPAWRRLARAWASIPVGWIERSETHRLRAPKALIAAFRCALPSLQVARGSGRQRILAQSVQRGSKCRRSSVAAWGPLLRRRSGPQAATGCRKGRWPELSSRPPERPDRIATPPLANERTRGMTK